MSQRTTPTGKAVHPKTTDHLPGHSRYARFNKRFAVLITQKVGTMTTAYLFFLLDLVSLPGAITSHSAIIMVNWIAQTFLQLVLLPIIIVGQNVQAEASDARSELTFEHTETIIDRLDTNTADGLGEVMSELRVIKSYVQPTPAKTVVRKAVAKKTPPPTTKK